MWIEKAKRNHNESKVRTWHMKLHSESGTGSDMLKITKRPERLVLNKEGIVNSPTVVCISSLLPSVNVKSTIFSYVDTKPSALNIDHFKQNLIEKFYKQNQF